MSYTTFKLIAVKKPTLFFNFQPCVLTFKIKVSFEHIILIIYYTMCSNDILILIVKTQGWKFTKKNIGFSPSLKNIIYIISIIWTVYDLAFIAIDSQTCSLAHHLSLSISILIIYIRLLKHIIL